MADTVSPVVRGELRAELARRQISGRAAAKSLGVSPMWVSARLSGATQITVDDLARFAGLLGVPVARLLGDGTGPTSPTPTGPTPSGPTQPPRPGREVAA